MIGSRKAAVLPVPVSAQAMRSAPLKTMGKTALWMGVVRTKPRSPMPARMRSSSSMPANSSGVASCGATSKGTAVRGLIAV